TLLTSVFAVINRDRPSRGRSVGCLVRAESEKAGVPAREPAFAETRSSDGDRHLGHLAELGLDRDVLGDTAARDDADGPLPRRGEEAEDALVGDDYLAGELTGVVEQAGVGRTGAGDDPLDDGLGRQV